MSIIDLIKNFIFPEQKKAQTTTIYENQEERQEIHSIWDYLKFQENTQAFHITNVLGFEEWIPMDEILRRIKEIFGMDYKNQRSLYPYIKTLVDCGLVETSSVGGKKKWRKKDTLIKISSKQAMEQRELEIGKQFV